MDHQGKVVNLHCLLGEGKVVNLHTGLYIKELLYRRIQEVENKISTPSHICMVGNVVDANSFIGVHNAGDNQRGLLSVRGSTQKKPCPHRNAKLAQLHQGLGPHHIPLFAFFAIPLSSSMSGPQTLSHRTDGDWINTRWVD